jgi:2-oxoglutarate dehydrogenase E2 component (dihydrolipoamide succinyltransferase)
MGVSVSEGTVTRWLKQPGDEVVADEILLEIATDKVDTEVPSPAAGVLLEILVAEGDTVAVGSTLATIGPPGARPVAAPDPGPEPVGGAAGRDHTPRATGGLVSPVVARIAAEHSIDPASLTGTGHGGRVTKKDILALLNGAAATPSLAVPRADPLPPPVEPADGEALEPISPMRRGIAEHMRRSLDVSAHVTSTIDVDMSNVVAIRDRLKREYEQAYGVNPTYLAFIARATVETLRDYPYVNGEIRGDKIVTKKFVNLGFAVELHGGTGLIVPVVKHAEDLNLLGMARAIADVAARARAKQLRPDEVLDGSFTITNPGGVGTVDGTPIINQPQAAILGTYALVKRAWVARDESGHDAIAIRPIMRLSLTYDHRLIDGALAGRFLRDLRDRLETWEQHQFGAGGTSA